MLGWWRAMLSWWMSSAATDVPPRTSCVRSITLWAAYMHLKQFNNTHVITVRTFTNQMCACFVLSKHSLTFDVITLSCSFKGGPIVVSSRTNNLIKRLTLAQVYNHRHYMMRWASEENYPMWVLCQKPEAYTTRTRIGSIWVEMFIKAFISSNYPWRYALASM